MVLISHFVYSFIINMIKFSHLKSPCQLSSLWDHLRSFSSSKKARSISKLYLSMSRMLTYLICSFAPRFFQINCLLNSSSMLFLNYFNFYQLQNAADFARHATASGACRSPRLPRIRLWARYLIKKSKNFQAKDFL